MFNGGQSPHLAGDVSAALVKAGYHAGTVGNTTYRTTTAVLYGAGAAASGRAIAAMFSVTATADPSVQAGHVEVLLAASAAVPAATPSSQSSATPAAIPTTGTQGGVLRASNGVPCVN